jgi:hypothetical protein
MIDNSPAVAVDLVGENRYSVVEFIRRDVSRKTVYCSAQDDAFQLGKGE